MLTPSDQRRLERFLASDSYLMPHREAIGRRIAHIGETGRRLTGKKVTLADFASGHEYFGLHFIDGQWVLREWAPNATAVFLIGELSGWSVSPDLAMTRIAPNGVWELRLPADRLRHGDLYRLHMQWPGGGGDRIPAWARRVVQDPQSLIFNAQVWRPEKPYTWQIPNFKVPQQPPLIYEV
ncbi:MAG: 1,4-alpha-glucan-branching enzyme, partial [Desulfosarcinaceae bacterium]